MGSQLFYVWAFSFGIHLQRSLAFLQNGKFERSGFQKYEQPTKVFCLIENWEEYFSEIKSSSNLKKFYLFERRDVISQICSTSTIFFVLNKTQNFGFEFF